MNVQAVSVAKSKVKTTKKAKSKRPATSQGVQLSAVHKTEEGADTKQIPRQSFNTKNSVITKEPSLKTALTKETSRNKFQGRHRSVTSNVFTSTAISAKKLSFVAARGKSATPKPLNESGDESLD